MNLPLINASLNGLATILLLAGYVFIRQGRRQAHERCMLAAFATSCVFLACYLYHKLVVVKGVHTPFRGPAGLKPVYLAMLGSHILLAIAIVPMALRTIWLGRRGDYARHRALARWTWPIWLYVSVTGVLVYLVLYVIWPSA
jgi:uncharacterized membrane protein YozB (DUF420 family)